MIVKKNKLAQLFCKHKHVGWYEENSKFRSLKGERHYRICNDCGKVLDERFWEYEGMGYK